MGRAGPTAACCARVGPVQYAYVSHRLLASTMPAVTHASSGSASKERVRLNMVVDSSNTITCLHLHSKQQAHRGSGVVKG